MMVKSKFLMNICKYAPNKADILLYVIPGLFALISLLIINPPKAYEDLFLFYSYHHDLRYFSLADFCALLKASPDFLILIYIYIFTKVGIPINILLAIITFATVFIILKTSFLILGKSKKTVFSYLFITTAISVAGLLSGIRNLHSIAFVYGALYLFTKNQNIKAAGSYIIALLVHFSSLMYVSVFAFVKLRVNVIYILWFISFVGFLLPFVLQPYINSEIQYSSIPIIGKIQHYALKRDYYYTLTFRDFKIIFASILKFCWYIAMLAFLFFKYKKKDVNIWVKMLIGMSILMNLSLTMLTVFERISFLSKILFIVCLLQDELIPHKFKKWIFIYFLFLFIIQLTLYIKGLLFL